MSGERPRYLRCPGCEAMVRYERGIVHYLQDAAILVQNPLHPGRAMMDSWLEAVPKDTLRWHVSTRPSASKIKKSVLRSALQGKWYKLMCRALQQRGYRPDGRQIETGEKGLTGTLEVIVHSGDKTLPESESQHLKRCLKIVEVVEQEQEKQSRWRTK